jgi:hemolysin III
MIVTVARLDDDTELVVVERPRFRGALHLWTFVAAIPAGVILTASAPRGRASAGAAVYTLGVLAMLGVSAAFHRVPWTPEARAVLARLDHSTIFLAIAGTYTPIALVALEGAARAGVLAVVWAGAALGMTLEWLPVRPPRWLFTSIYLVVGWPAIGVVPELWDALGPVGFAFLLAGGLMYSLGAVVYATMRPDPWPAHFGFHEVFHACTVLALAFHFVAIAGFTIPRG